MGSQKKYYAVIRGRKPGIYNTWYGPGGAEEQVHGYAGAVFKGFATPGEARRWLESPVAKPENLSPRVQADRESAAPASPGATAAIAAAAPGATDVPGAPDWSPERIVIYTDGGCVGNPGPGGYGAIILAGEGRREIAGGFRWTTNNRMELMACIAALETLPAQADVVLHSDSRYVVNGIDRGWARRWRARGWMRTESEKAQNVDLWSKLLDLCDGRRIRFVWVHGHAGNRENERCDQLATAAAQGTDLQEDLAYVRGLTHVPGGAPEGTV